MIDKEKIRRKESQLLDHLHTELITKVNDIDRRAYHAYSQQTAHCFKQLPDLASRELCLQKAEKDMKKIVDSNLEFLNFVEVD